MNTECVVCMDEKVCLIISCLHSICKSCYIKSGNTTCPCCRKEIHDEIDEETRDLANFVIEQNKSYKKLEDDYSALEDERDDIHDLLIETNHALITVMRKAKRGLNYNSRPQIKLI